MSTSDGKVSVSSTRKRRTSRTPSREIIEIDSDSDNDGTNIVVASVSSSLGRKGRHKKKLNSFKPPQSTSGTASRPVISLIDSDQEGEEADVRRKASSTVAIISEEDEKKTSAKTSTSVHSLSVHTDDSPRRRRPKRERQVDSNNTFGTTGDRKDAHSLYLEHMPQGKHGVNDDGDRKLAQRLQREEEDLQSKVAEANESDIRLAKLLQDQEDKQSTKANPNQEANEMKKSTSGKAVVAVQRVIQLVQDAKIQFPTLAGHVDAVAIDDMVNRFVFVRDVFFVFHATSNAYLPLPFQVYLAEKLLKQQQEFINTNTPSYIDIVSETGKGSKHTPTMHFTEYT